ncbi:hypothetical protein SEA_NATHANVAAG_62 [Arthrobacter phage NathanVaag]|nr:hypothetical protein SEA_NATHANVAAG_62 [Arthrobacter phage NathanVaag]
MAELREYFIGGVLDGTYHPHEPNMPPQLVAYDDTSKGTSVYVRQPIFDDEKTRNWVCVESPADLLAMRDYQQTPAAGRKHFTLFDLRAALSGLEAMGFPDDTPIRVQVSWTGHLKHLSASRDDEQAEQKAGNK